MTPDVAKDLTDAKVRHKGLGYVGKIRKTTPEQVTIAWTIPYDLLPRLETYKLDDGRLFDDIEIFTAGEGWLYLGTVIGNEVGRDRDLERYTPEVQTEGDHNPFQYQNSLGPGPRKRTLKQTRRYKCKSAGAYSQRCQDRDRGNSFLVKVDKKWKQRYSKEWEKFDQRRNKK